jgi:SSS family solute:Na+ symporter
MVVWVPCILIGVWASGQLNLPPEKAKLVLGVMVNKFTDPWMAGLVTAGILAAIMSSLDSQFLCLGTMFTHDVALQNKDPDALSESQKIKTARIFVGLVVAGTFALSLITTKDIFDLGIWCFSGFAGLAPLVIAALYWRRTTAAGAIACVGATAITWTLLFVNSLSHEAGQGEFLIAGVMPVTFIVLASTVSLVVVSLCTSSPDERHLGRFFTPQGNDSTP